MKQFVLVDQIQSPPQANVGAYSYYRVPSGIRLWSASWQAALPAGKLVTDCFDDHRLTIGNTQRQINVMDMDRALSVEDSATPQGIINNVAGALAEIPIPLAEHSRKLPQSTEQGAIDTVSGMPPVLLELQARALAVPAVLGLILCIEPLDEVAGQLNVLRGSDGKPVLRDGNMVPTLTKWRVNPIQTAAGLVVVEDFQAFKKDRLESLQITDPDAGGKVLNRVVIEKDRVKIFDRTKQEVDNELRRAGMNPAAGLFDYYPTLYDRNSDAADWIGHEIKVFLYFTAALGNRDTALAAAAGSVKFITRHRGLLD